MNIFLCPFCMGKHKLDFCPDKKKPIPRSYREIKKKNLPLFYLFTIGYSGHGKTCFLSSLFYSLYQSVAQRWPGFSFLSLNQSTLDKIHRDYVNILADLKIPAKTPIMFPEPLLIKMQKFPLKKNMFSNQIKQQEVVFVFYDIGGGTFEVDRKIEENLPIIKNVPCLLFLVDLPGLLKSEEDFNAVERKLHGLFNIIINTVEKYDLRKKKSLIISFTKADLMEGNEDLFGPLTTWMEDIFPDELPVLEKVEYYVQELMTFSGLIGSFFLDKFPMLYNTLSNNFKNIYFSIFSALGHDPVKGMLNDLEPIRIFDPIFFTLINAGCL